MFLIWVNNEKALSLSKRIAIIKTARIAIAINPFFTHKIKKEMELINLTKADPPTQSQSA